VGQRVTWLSLPFSTAAQDLYESAAHRDKSREWNVSNKSGTSVNFSNSGVRQWTKSRTWFCPFHGLEVCFRTNPLETPEMAEASLAHFGSPPLQVAFAPVGAEVFDEATPNPTPYTLHPKPQTLNPQP